MNAHRRDLLALSGALFSTGVLAGCAGRVPTRSSDPPRATATATRASPDVDPGTVATLVDGNTAFGLALHRTLVDAEPGANAFLSPYSLSLVLAMAWAGAAGETRPAMADALRFRLDGDRLHPAFNRLDRTLEAGTEAAREAAEEDDDYRLTAVNAAWTQEGYPFRDAFLDTLARHYGAGMNLVDFRSDPDAARTRINDWVADETDGRIDDLLPEGVVTELTRFVLTNAVHFEATWAETFDEADTRPGEFAALDGTTQEVSMMSRTNRFPYATVDSTLVVELPYVGERTGMLLLVPPRREFERFERELTAERLDALTGALVERRVDLSMPRFTFRSTLALRPALSTLGMGVAFDPDAADFGRMVDSSETSERVSLTAVVQKGFVAVDETGTEAVAASGAVGGGTSMPPQVTVDRPFLFLIRDRETGTVLFLGRVVDAAAAQEARGRSFPLHPPSRAPRRLRPTPRGRTARRTSRGRTRRTRPP